jgi:hypothetical protein
MLLSVRAVANAYIYRWDTVCFGELRLIYPIALSQDGEMLYSVHSRDPVVIHEEREKTKEESCSHQK